MPLLKKTLAESDGAALLAELKRADKVVLRLGEQSFELTAEDVQVTLKAKPGWAAAQGPSCVVVLSTELTAELIREGLAYDLVRFIQDARKQLQLDYTDTIELGLVSASSDLRTAVEEHRDYILRETLAQSLQLKSLANVNATEIVLGEQPAQLFVAPQGLAGTGERA
jgi:isoleucyl-tRNA synthetase